MSEQYATLAELEAVLVEDKFYGEILAKFVEGRVVSVKKTESIKLSERGCQ